MSTKNIILLKSISLLILFAYFTTYAWISFLFLLGEVYAPIKNPIISFEFMVIAFCVSVIFLCIFWTQKKRFMQLLSQNIIIIVLSVPLFSTVFDVLKIGVDDNGNPVPAILGILLLTIGLITFNDHLKLKKV